LFVCNRPPVARNMPIYRMSIPGAEVRTDLGSGSTMLISMAIQQVGTGRTHANLTPEMPCKTCTASIRFHQWENSSSRNLIPLSVRSPCRRGTAESSCTWDSHACPGTDWCIIRSSSSEFPQFWSSVGRQVDTQRFINLGPGPSGYCPMSTEPRIIPLTHTSLLEASGTSPPSFLEGHDG